MQSQAWGTVKAAVLCVKKYSGSIVVQYLVCFYGGPVVCVLLRL